MATNYTDQGVDPETGLPLRERLFVDYLLTDPRHNQTLAYYRAGYEAETIDTARAAAKNLIDRPNVAIYYRARLDDRAARLAVSADRVLLELAAIAYARRSDFVLDQETGEIAVKPGVAEEYLGAVESSEVTKLVRVIPQGDDRPPVTETEYKARFKLHSKTKAIELLCRHLGLIANELPELEVLLNRLPREVAGVFRKLLAQTPTAPALPAAIGDGVPHA